MDSHNIVYQSLLHRLPSIKDCSVYYSNKDLVISAPNADVLGSLMPSAMAIATQVHSLGNNLILKCGNDIVCRWPVGQVLKSPDPDPELEIPLISLMPDPPRKLAIVRMDTNQAVYITSEMHTIAGRTCAPGEDVSRWHIPEELYRLRQELGTHGVLTNFEYSAFNLELQPIKNTVNAWLVPDWRGVPVRVVELLHQELI